MDKKLLKKIKEIVEEFFQQMTYDPEVEVLAPEEKTIPINLKVEEPQILIGERGQTLGEVQHLLKAILRRKIDEEFYINLDINDYKKKKKEYLKELATSVADQVSLSKRERILGPMPSFERRIIHLELAERKDVTTESLGQEPDRRVIIRPYP